MAGRRDPASIARSITSGASTCSMTRTAAPITPARSPSWLGTIRSDACRQRQRALEGDLADPGEQLLVGTAEVPADHDHARVEEVDTRGEHLAEAASGVADHARRDRVARADQRDHVACVLGRPPAAVRRVASAPPPATASRQPRLPQRQTTSSWPLTRTWPMSPAAPWAPRWMLPAGDDAAADAGADLDEEQVLGRRASWSSARPGP